MKSKTKNILKLAALLIIIHILPTSCNKENEVSDKQLDTELTNQSECKRNKTIGENEIPNTKSGIEYSYDEATKTLNLRHINAGFNCNVEGIDCKTTLVNGLLTLEETQSGMAARCNCIYDIDLVVKDVEKQSYTLKVKELLVEEEEQISFVIDLTISLSGDYYVTRENYPWGQ